MPKARTPDQPHPDSIVPKHPLSHYKTMESLTGYYYNNLYHMFVQHGDVGMDFKAWDADTMELIAHNTGYTKNMDGLNQVVRVIPEDNWNWRYNGDGYKYPPEIDDG